mmetsp:Transcript_102764/g.197265  ORF Transcript_102764/g.197265 Transcript_102764/m.197265 type:complete len:240 (-) Transcript_102764:84-803(-)
MLNAIVGAKPAHFCASRAGARACSLELRNQGGALTPCGTELGRDLLHAQGQASVGGAAFSTTSALQQLRRAGRSAFESDGWAPRSDTCSGSPSPSAQSLQLEDVRFHVLYCLVQTCRPKTLLLLQGLRVCETAFRSICPFGPSSVPLLVLDAVAEHARMQGRVLTEKPRMLAPQDLDLPQALNILALAIFQALLICTQVVFGAEELIEQPVSQRQGLLAQRLVVAQLVQLSAQHFVRPC